MAHVDVPSIKKKNLLSSVVFWADLTSLRKDLTLQTEQ